MAKSDPLGIHNFMALASVRKLNKPKEHMATKTNDVAMTLKGCVAQILPCLQEKWEIYKHTDVLFVGSVTSYISNCFQTCGNNY